MVNSSLQGIIGRAAGKDTKVKKPKIVDISKAGANKGDGETTPFDDALKLLLKHARKDTGGAKRCAMFILSLWNGDDFKADLQALMYTDKDIFEAMLSVYRTLYERNQQLSSVVTEEQIRPIYELWGGTLRTK